MVDREGSSQDADLRRAALTDLAWVIIRTPGATLRGDFIGTLQEAWRPVLEDAQPVRRAIRTPMLGRIVRQKAKAG
jgi:hypothetical protein